MKINYITDKRLEEMLSKGWKLCSVHRAEPTEWTYNRLSATHKAVKVYYTKTRVRGLWDTVFLVK